MICLTPGQAATHRGSARSDQELAELRRAELAVSCRILQVSSGQALDYPDGRLDQADFYAVVGDLTYRVRRLRPHIILTPGPDGGVTGHPDHSMASIFATMAYHWAGRTDRYPEQLRNGITPHRTQKLYYATAPFTLPDRQPVSLPPSTTTIDITGYLEVKIDAFRAHVTQAPLLHRFESAMRQRGSTEFFHLAATTHPSVMRPETDLLAGIDE